MVTPDADEPSLGMPMPSFALPDVTGAVVSSSSLSGRPVLVVFICPHCPYVRHVGQQLAAIGREYADRVHVVAINSNDHATRPEDGPEGMAAEAAAEGYTFPYLIDADSAVARSFGAACTPDPFLFDAEWSLVYRGQLDDTRPSGDAPATARDLRAAVDAVLAGERPVADQHPPVGCSIKWADGA